MKALSVRQPWAWLIAAGHKPVENRTWPTRYRGPILIHAGQSMTAAEYESAFQFALDVGGTNLMHAMPGYRELERGGIVGIAELTHCWAPSARTSPWHIAGQYGFQMRDARPLPFVPYKGQLGFFDVPDGVVQLLGDAL